MTLLITHQMEDIFKNRFAVFSKFRNVVNLKFSVIRDFKAASSGKTRNKYVTKD